MPTLPILVLALVYIAPITLASRLLVPRGLLVDRQSCPALTCSSNNGNTICMAADEVCCQFLGVDPFTCSLSHPYCCPPDKYSNQVSCGTDSSCSGPVITTTSPANSRPTPKPNAGAPGVAMGSEYGPMLVAALAVGGGMGLL